jgi:hypothetical protein
MLFLLPRRRQTGGTLAAAGVLLLALAGPAPARPLPPDETPPTPVGRGGTLPTPYTLGALPNTLADPADLGQHSWRDHDSETLGILYACRAGFLDLVHIRNAADWTLHLQARLQRALLRGEPALEVEGADRGVRLHIAFPTPLAPEEREALAPALALQLARRYAFILLDWHEVTTWYGHGVLPFVSERPSAFSVDDTASHLVGLDLAERALADPQRALLPALTAQLGPLLQELGVQPRAQTTLAMAQVRGLWWNPHRSWPANSFITRRQVDSGHPEQTFTAWQVPGLAACADQPAAQWQVDHLDHWAQGRFADWAVAWLRPDTPEILEASFGQDSPQRRTGQLRVPEDLPAVLDEVRRRMREELGPRADQPD